jgi:peroxiredoxin
MKSYIIVLFTVCFLFAFEYGYTQIGLKGSIINAEQNDSVALFNPFNKQFQEKIMLGKKGSFEFTYKPSEIGFYFLGLKNGKSVLLVLKPNGSGQIELDASTGSITKVINSEENMLLKLFQDLMEDYNKKQDLLEATNKSEEQKQLEKQLIEQDRTTAAENLLIKNANNYAAAALLEYLPIDDFIIIHDSVLKTLLKKYPENGIVKAKYQEVEKSKRLAIGFPAPEITMENPEGKMFSLSSLKGKVVLIDFWASWCRPCREENPNVVRLYKTYEKYGFDILGVSLDNNKERWLRAIEADGLIWNHVSDLKYWQSAAGQSYGVNSIPFTVLVDRNGNIIAKGLRGEALEKKLKEVLLR